jgi:hypothetical protein
MANLTIALNAVTATTITIDNANRNAGYDVIDVQVSVRKDFQFVPAPIYPFPSTAQQALTGLSQGNNYWVRARERVAATGAVLPWTTPLLVYTPISVAQTTAPLSLMVKPAIIVPPEPVIWSVSTGADAARPASNLATDSPAEQCWVTNGHIFFDTGGQPIDTIALLAHNAPAAMTYNVVSYLTAANRAIGASAQFTSTAQNMQVSAGLPGRPSYNALYRLAAPRTERFWTIQFSGTWPPQNLLTVSYGVVGLARTAKNIAADKVEAALDYGSIERLRDGTPDRRCGFRGRRVEFEIALMTEAQWETQFADLRQKIGLSDPVLVVPNTQTAAFLHDRILYGPLATLRAQQPYAPRFSQQFAIESLI